MAIDDDSSIYLDVINMLGILIIIGVSFYLYMSYSEMKTNVSKMMTDYNKINPPTSDKTHASS